MIASARRRVRNDVASSLVAICIAVALGVGALYYYKALSQLGDTASSNASLTFDDREIAGGNSVIVDQAAAYEARSLIPVSATYRLVVGRKLRKQTELTENNVEGWFRYFLMPRRPRLDARWIICYGCDTSALGGVYAVRWKDDIGISIGQLR
jgi:hypothetical protein